MIPIDYRRMERAVARGTFRALIWFLLLLIIIGLAVAYAVGVLPWLLNEN